MQGGKVIFGIGWGLLLFVGRQNPNMNIYIYIYMKYYMGSNLICKLVKYGHDVELSIMQAQHNFLDTFNVRIQISRIQTGIPSPLGACSN
jgi:hypothetical protein